MNRVILVMEEGVIAFSMLSVNRSVNLSTMSFGVMSLLAKIWAIIGFMKDFRRVPAIMKSTVISSSRIFGRSVATSFSYSSVYFDECNDPPS